MNQKWNLQDIRPINRKKEHPKHTQSGESESEAVSPRRKKRQPLEESNTETEYEAVEIVDGRSAKRKRVIVFSVIGAVILGLGFFFSVLMGGAEVIAYPKFKDTTVQATFTAHKNPSADELSYELLSIEAEGERQVSASGEEEVSERATGKIMIYNTHSEAPQRLIKNTRFESPEGLIFKIQESVEVPGMSRSDEGDLVPGVATAEVFADGTGEQYNIDPTRFTIPGLEGTAQYDNMYGESSQAFTGGFEGSKYIIDDEELQTAKQSLHLELRNALLERIDEEKPAGFILYEDAITFVFDSLPSTGQSDQLVTIKERARLQVPVFQDSEFAAYLAESTVAGFEEAPVTLPDPFTLTFSYASPTTTTSDLSEQDEIKFKLNGQTRIIWEYDEEQLKADLAGKSKTALSAALSGYPAIERAEAVIRPFWKRTFPEDPSEISIIKQIGDKRGE